MAVWDEMREILVCAPLSGCLAALYLACLPPTPREQALQLFVPSVGQVAMFGIVVRRLPWFEFRRDFAFADPQCAIFLIADVGTFVGLWYEPEYVAANQCAERIMDQPSPQRVVETEQVLVSVSISLCGPPGFLRRRLSALKFCVSVFASAEIRRQPRLSASVCVCVGLLFTCRAAPQWWMFVLKAARQVNSREWRKIFIGLV